MSEPAPAPDKRTNASRKRSNRREEILQAAADVFAAQGFHNASLADIAATLGITPAGILHHFGSKTGLLTAVLELRDSADPPPEDERFLDHLASTAERSATRPGTTQLYAVLSAESTTAGHPAQVWFRNRYKELHGEVELAILDRLDSAYGKAPAEEPAESGERVPREVRDAATAVIAVMDGLRVQWLLEPDAVDMAAVTRTVIDALVTQLGAAEPAGVPDRETGSS